ncbi:hypothetical protein PFICI_01277 [Pestalotiopsis fici W106-1]|uniref:DUF7702 domain-containing protein n=1 Tax=Pestalotiopsis fici (strain W106-1 / CGMCC3.15140) TaxID=1229662 RepID=W3XN81_PESFW|nr:uncharacterized protein PFICI_01277 [Pestalotiopsis fici W106-1]ETS87449.1 hypothetical protein PFICI_01277 [Pestalotiopsis fici W106-1]
MSESAVNLPPPSLNIVNLAIADLAIYAVLFFPTCYLTWMHGKNGMVCWPIFVSYFGLRFASDAYLIVHRADPLLPNTVAIMTNAGSLACLSLTIIGLLYEVNITLPYPRRWTEKIILGVTHLCNTAGIALATYGGSPSATGEGGVASQLLNRIGNCLMLGVMATMCWWIWPTWRRTSALHRKHPMFKPCRALIVAAAVAIPFQCLRLIYNTTYAFDHLAILDPITGTFAVRLILQFIPQIGVAVATVVGGWFGIPPKDKSNPGEEMACLEQLPSSSDRVLV